MTETTPADTPRTAADPGAAELLHALAESLGGQVAYYALPSRLCRFANVVYAKINGFTVASIVGKTPEEVFGADQWAKVALHAERCASGARVKYLHEQRADDGSAEVFLSLDCAQQDVGGAIACLNERGERRVLARFVAVLLRGFVCEKVSHRPCPSRFAGGLHRLSFRHTIAPSKTGEMGHLNQQSRTQNDFSKGSVIKNVLSLALPMTLFLCLMAPWIVRVLFERGAFGPQDTQRVAEVLRFALDNNVTQIVICLLYTSPSPRD